MSSDAQNSIYFSMFNMMMTRSWVIIFLEEVQRQSSWNQNAYVLFNHTRTLKFIDHVEDDEIIHWLKKSIGSLSFKFFAEIVYRIQREEELQHPQPIRILYPDTQKWLQEFE